MEARQEAYSGIGEAGGGVGVSPWTTAMAAERNDAKGSAQVYISLRKKTCSFKSTTWSLVRRVGGLGRSGADDGRDGDGRLEGKKTTVAAALEGLRLPFLR